MPSENQPESRRSFTAVIDTHHVRPNLSASHLLVENEEALFVDTGTALGIPYLLQALARHKLSVQQVKYIVLTHIHLDHAGGAGLLMQHCPNATLLVHPIGLRHMLKPEKLVAASIDVYGAALFAKLYGTVVAVDQQRATATGEGYLLNFNGRHLQFLDTPGHARHHLSIWDAAEKRVFAGDTLGLAYPELQLEGKPPFLFPTTSPAAFDPITLEHSIKRLMALQPQTCCLTHFGPISPDSRSIERLVRLIRDHADLGQHDSSEQPHLASKVGARVHAAYLEYCRDHGGTPLERGEFDSLIAGDMELNAQGIAVLRDRQGQAT